METKSRLQTSWGEVRVIHYYKTPLENIQGIGDRIETRKRLEKDLNKKLDKKGREKLQNMKEKLLNSLKETYENRY